MIFWINGNTPIRTCPTTDMAAQSSNARRWR
jgi:hypothetical protein